MGATGKASAVAPEVKAVEEVMGMVVMMNNGKVVDKRDVKIVVHPTKKPDCPVAKCDTPKVTAGCRLVRDDTKNADGCRKHACAKLVCTPSTKESKCRINPSIGAEVAMKAGDVESVNIATLITAAPKGRRLAASCGCNGAGSKPCQHAAAASLCYGLMNLHGHKTCPQGTKDCRPKNACPCSNGSPCKQNNNHLCHKAIKQWGKWICTPGTKHQNGIAACAAQLKKVAEEAAAKKVTAAAAKVVADKAKAVGEAKKIAEALVEKAKVAEANAAALVEKAKVAAA